MSKARAKRSVRPSRKTRRPQRTGPSEAQAIVKVAAPTEKPWELSNEQVVLLKNYLKIADASDVELAGCLEVSRRYRLDPFKQGQIWFVKRWDKNASSVAGPKGAYVYTPQVGIYGMLHIAARDHADYGSVSEPEFGPMFMHEIEGHKFKAPEWCRVKAFKKNVGEPTVATIYFEEFCPAVWDNARLFWAKMPRAQLEKCAKARVIRTAYPDLGGLLIPEEMDRIKDEYTESGRQIIVKATEGTHLGTRGAAQAVLEAKLAGKMPLNPEAPIDVPSQPAAQPAPKENPVAKKPDPKPIETKYVLTIDWSAGLASPILTGDLEELGVRLAAENPPLKMEWGKDEFWHVPAAMVPAVMQIASKNAFAVREVHPNSSAGQQRSAPPASRKPAATGGGASTQRPAAAGPEIVTGTIERVQPSSDASRAVVTFVKSTGGKAGWTCFDKDIYAILTNNLGKLATVIIQTRESKGKTYTNLIGLKKVGSTEYDDDGKTPCIQRSQQEPGRTLF